MKKFLLMFVFILFLSGCKSVKEEIKDLKTQVNSLKENVVYKNEFRFEINSLQEKTENLQKECDNIKSKIDKCVFTKNKIKNIDNSKKELLLRISSLERQYKNLQNKIQELNLAIAKISSEKQKNNSKCLKFFKPTVFITKNKAHIYDSNGRIIDTWNKHVTFTSYIKEGNKLKITGYFVNKKFKNALDKDWWININDVEKKFKEKN